MTDLRQGAGQTVHGILDALETLDHIDTPIAALIAAERLHPLPGVMTREERAARAIAAAAHWIRYAELVAANASVGKDPQP